MALGRGHSRLLFGPGRSRSCNILLIWLHDTWLPQAAYGPSKCLGRQHCRHSQVLAGQFTHQYPPDLQRRQKRRTPMADLTTDQVVMVVNPQLPRVLWPIAKVTKVHPSDNGTVCLVDINIKRTVRLPSWYHSPRYLKMTRSPEPPNKSKGLYFFYTFMNECRGGCCEFSAVISSCHSKLLQAETVYCSAHAQYVCPITFLCS